MTNTFNIENIRGALKGGGARKTLFQVFLSSPWSTEMGVIAPFMIQATELPPSSIGNIRVPYMGRTINVAGDRTFDPWPVDVINDEDFKVRHAFEDWHNRINSLQGNLNTTGSSAPKNYKVNAEIRQFSKADDLSPLRVYKMYGVWPSDIGGIELDWSATNQIQTFRATLQYDWYEVVGGSTGLVA